MTGSGNRTGPSEGEEPAMCASEKLNVPGHGNRIGHKAKIARVLFCILILMCLVGLCKAECEAHGQIRARDVSQTECLMEHSAIVADGMSCHPRWCRLLVSLPLFAKSDTIDIQGVIKTMATSIEKHVNTEQHQQIIRTNIVWSGCSTFSYVHPMRAIVHLGSLRVVALIDTGSDYDAVDRDLSVVQHEQGNQAFRQRHRSSESVVGF